MTTSRRDCVAAALGAAVASQCPLARAAGEELVVGFIYVGPRDDFGYNQAHATAAGTLRDLPGVRVVEQERVPESDAVATVMEAMIVEEGARLLYPTSYGYYEPHVPRLARRHPDVVFRHCGAAWRDGQDPANIGSYLGHMHEAQHLAGMVAGAHAAGKEIGFVASNRYPGVMRNLNAFALGAQRIDPDARMRVVFTGSWSHPVREAEAVNAMADRGFQVVGCSVDSARTVIETARRRGLHACGYNASARELGGDSYLTAAVANWAPLYQRTARQVMDGIAPPNFHSGGLAEGLVDIDGYGPAVSAATRQLVDARRAALAAGEAWIWSGPLHDLNGQELVPAGKRIERDDELLRRMDWFVQGVL